MAVLAGGLSHEREVSLRSGRRLSAALRGVGMAVREWDADAALIERLRTERPDAVVGLPARMGQADREGRTGPRRARHPGLGGPAARDLP